MNNQTLIGIIIVVILVVGGYFLVTSAPTQAPQEENTATTTPQETATTTPEIAATSSTAYTLLQVATHKDKTSCWSAVNGSVYDLTSWIGKHPGGDAAILSICGKDGSTAFEKQHGGMAKQAALLTTFKIGVLTQ